MRQLLEGEKFHETRRMGNASTQAPTRRLEGLCAYEGCPDHGRTLRVTTSGYAVVYCYAHEVEAHERFGS